MFIFHIFKHFNIHINITVSDRWKKCKLASPPILSESCTHVRNKDKDKDLFIGPAGICCGIF